MKVTAIGDIHGRKNWIGPITGYDSDTNTGYKECLKDGTIDKVIIVGDYTDPYTFEGNSYEDSLDQLEEILTLKEQYGDKLILLLGNHDCHYITGLCEPCSRYDRFYTDQYRDLFMPNLGKFRFAYQIENTLYTHAGISQHWYDSYFKDLHETDYKGLSLGDALHAAWKQLITKESLKERDIHEKILFTIGYHRGGWDKTGGPVWCDKYELLERPLEGYHQVVGHNRTEDVKTYDKYTVSKYPEQTSVTMVDCLAKYDHYYTKEF
jgi:predicted phosphodiesterase